MTTINDFAVVGLVKEGGRSYLQFEIDTSFDPNTTSFQISVNMGDK